MEDQHLRILIKSWILDIAIINANLNIKTNKLFEHNYSDHTSTIIELIQNMKTNMATNEKPILTNSITDWKNYKEFVNNNLNCKILVTV